MQSLINELIKNSGFKQRYIANQIGVNENTIVNWMKHKSWPRLDQAVMLADLLGCSVDDLYIKK